MKWIKIMTESMLVLESQNVHQLDKTALVTAPFIEVQLEMLLY